MTTATCSSRPFASRKTTRRAFSAAASGTGPSLIRVTRTPPASASICSRLTDRAAPLSMASCSTAEAPGSDGALTTAGNSRPIRASVSPPTSAADAPRTAPGSTANVPRAIARCRICSGPSPFSDRLTPRTSSAADGSGTSPIDAARWRVTASRNGPCPRSVSRAGLASPSTVATSAPRSPAAVT